MSINCVSSSSVSSSFPGRPRFAHTLSDRPLNSIHSPISGMHSRQSTVHTYCAKKKPQKKPKPQKPKKRAPGNGPVRESSKYSLEALVEDMKFRTGFGALDIAASVHGEHPRELLALPLLAEMAAQRRHASKMLQQMTDDSIPPFHKEAANLMRKSLDPASASAVLQKLQDAYANAVLQPSNLMAILSNNPDLAINPGDLMVRLGAKARDLEALHWFETAPMHSVRLNDKTLPYDSMKQHLQSFTNSPVEEVHMLPGSTHVAVGFTDLGSLAAAVSRWQVGDSSKQLTAAPLEFDDIITNWDSVYAELRDQLQEYLGDEDEDDDSLEASLEDRSVRQSLYFAQKLGAAGSNGLLNSQLLHWLHAVQQLNQQCSRGDQAASRSTAVGAVKPVVWVGFDASAYAVAKTLVIAEMLKQDADTDAILQVWYSSCWSYSTQAAFKQALASLLSQSRNTSVTHSAAVQQFLHHWQQSKEVLLPQSRQEWLESVTRAHAFIGGLEKQHDRVAVARYIFTGELLQADVGSSVMCFLPTEQGMRAQDENFLQSISMSALFKTYNALSGATDCSIIDAGVEVLRRRIAALKQMVIAGAVEIQVHHRQVLPSDSTVASQIQQYKPDTISWSNVPDYFGVEDFHCLAQRCSAAATMHFMHSMNWVRDVKGANHLDLLLGKMAAVAGGVDEDDLHFMNQSLYDASQAGTALISQQYIKQSASQVMRIPPVDNPKNILDYFMYCGSFQLWTAAFLAAERPDGEAGTDATLHQWLQGLQRNSSKEAADPAAKPVTAPFRQLFAELVKQYQPEEPVLREIMQTLHLADLPEGIVSQVMGGPTYAPWSRANSTLALVFVTFGETEV